MTIIEQLDAAKAENVELKKKNEELVEACAQLSEKADASAADAEKALTAVGTTLAELEGARAEIAALKAANAQLSDKVNALEADARSAEARAAEIAGHARAPVPAVPLAESSAEEIAARWARVRGNPKEAARFWNSLSATQQSALKSSGKFI